VPLAQRIPSKKTKWRGLIKAILIASGVVFVVWLLLSTLPDILNGPENAMRPMSNQVAALGGHKICSGGDPGYGPDNLEPWYSAVYTVPDNPDISVKIKDIASNYGYGLSEDTARINQLKQQGIPDQHGNISSSVGEPYDPNSDYLVADNGGKSLSVTIYRGNAPLVSAGEDCSVGDSGQLQPGHALLEMSLTFPDHKL
jgi:hypothetical protein